MADQKPEYKSVKVFCARMLALIGLALLVLTARQIYLHWQQLNVPDVLLDFALPVWLTIGLVPFLYLFSIYVAYDAAFRRINWEASDPRARWRSGLALLSALRFRTDTVRRFTGYWYFARKLGEAQTFSDARGVVAEFLDELRRAEQAKIDEEDRLKRYCGSQELDAEGRRLDRREFAETIAALQWLATCQMGWYRRGSRYRTDMLDLLGDDFTSQGLPRESGIKLHVAQDGQSWYAWRQTVTGWYFAIAAAGPPPDRWEYDSPEPPTGFPGENSSWGDGTVLESCQSQLVVTAPGARRAIATGAGKLSVRERLFAGFHQGDQRVAAEPKPRFGGPQSSGVESNLGCRWAGHRNRGRSRRSNVRLGSRCARKWAGALCGCWPRGLRFGGRFSTWRVEMNDFLPIKSGGNRSFHDRRHSVSASHQGSQSSLRLCAQCQTTCSPHLAIVCAP